MSAAKYRLYYIVSLDEKRPGPEFASLEAALSAARASQQACDILCPDGEWYARQETVGIDLSSGASSDSAARIERAAEEVVARMRSRPSRARRKPDDD